MNLPNRLTLFRIFLIPIFIFFLTTDVIKHSNVIGLLVFLIASITDFFDGYIARKNNIITDFGKLMDPLADKMLVVSALIIFTSQGLINSIVVIIIISRDFIINSIRLLALTNGKVISADIWGKAKTVFQMLAIITLLIYKSLLEFLTTDELFYIKYIAVGLIYIATVLTVFSLANYIIRNYRFFKINP